MAGSRTVCAKARGAARRTTTVNSLLIPRGLATGIFINIAVSDITSQTLGREGNSGEISLKANSVKVLDGGGINSSTLGAGNGGRVVIQGNEVTVSGINEAHRSFLLDEGFSADGAKRVAASNIGANTSSRFLGEEATGKAGIIEVNAGTLRVEKGGSITSGTTSPGAGGSIEIEVGEFHLTGQSTISTGSSQSDIAAEEGSQGLLVPAGRAGKIQIDSLRTITANESLISSSAEESEGGSITLMAGTDLVLSHNTVITAETSGPGDAGEINLEGKDSIIIEESSIKTVAVEADGGNIKLNAPNLIHLIDSQITSSVEVVHLQLVAILVWIRSLSFCKIAKFWPTPLQAKAEIFP